MFKVNENFLKLPGNYLFSTVGRRIAAYYEKHPDAHIIRMGIGDVTRPLCEAAVDALQKASARQATADGFHGYGPEQGYGFLRERISEIDFRQRGIEISPDEIFISDGAKSDTGNFVDVMSNRNRIAVTDPVYPVYIDSNVIAGRGGRLLPDGHWSDIIYLPCKAENDFVPMIPEETPDVIYLCYPNNPTGIALTHAQLKIWVDYARKNGCLILFDAAYEAYITEPDIPRSIYEIEGAREVAVEFRSFSKTAGFTGLRCGYTVVPHDIKAFDENSEKVSLNDLWRRRQTTKFNGAAYIVQRAAEALYTERGMHQVKETIDYYHRNAETLLNGLKESGFKAYGGINSPYVWVKAPNGMSSWDFFDMLLDKCHIATTPGSGFGVEGEGYIRLTAFSTYEDTIEAVKRIKSLIRN